MKTIGIDTFWTFSLSATPASPLTGGRSPSSSSRRTRRPTHTPATSTCTTWRPARRSLTSGGDGASYPGPAEHPALPAKRDAKLKAHRRAGRS